MCGYQLQSIQSSHLEVSIAKHVNQLLQKLLSLRLRCIWLDEVLLVAVLCESLVLLAEADHQLAVQLAGVLGVNVEGNLRQVFPPGVLLRKVCGRKLVQTLVSNRKIPLPARPTVQAHEVCARPS